MSLTNKVKDMSIQASTFYHAEAQMIDLQLHQTILITISCCYGNSMVAMEIFKEY